MADTTTQPADVTPIEHVFGEDGAVPYVRHDDGTVTLPALDDFFRRALRHVLPRYPGGVYPDTWRTEDADVLYERIAEHLAAGIGPTLVSESVELGSRVARAEFERLNAKADATAAQPVSIDDLPDMLKTARADLEKVVADLLAVLPVREYREDGIPYAAIVCARGAADKAEVTARRLEALMLPMVDDAIGNAGLAFEAVDGQRHRSQHERGDCTCSEFEAVDGTVAS